MEVASRSRILVHPSHKHISLTKLRPRDWVRVYFLHVYSTIQEAIVAVGKSVFVIVIYILTAFGTVREGRGEKGSFTHLIWENRGN